jgi:hypothetical protein
MIASSQKGRVVSVTAWFYILTSLGILVTCLTGVVGIRLLFQLKGVLSFPQLALAGAVVFSLALQGAIFTLLLMIFYDPKRRTAFALSKGHTD